MKILKLLMFFVMNGITNNYIMEAYNRITPEWIETLTENEIFVFDVVFQNVTLMVHQTLR